MKLLKKVLSVAAVLALVVTAFPANARAAADVVDFEDGNIPAGIIMAVLDDGTPDGDPAILSVVDFAGSKMLKIDSQANGTPKVKFMVADLVGVENVSKVMGIEYDLVIEQPSGEVAGWNGGTIGAGNWAAGGGWYNGDVGFTVEDYENSVTAVSHHKELIIPGFGFTDETGFFMFMNWANNGTDNYIDNVRLLDADGNAIEFLATAAVAVEEAAPAEAADVPKTGVVGLGLVYGLGALATGAFALRRKQK